MTSLPERDLETRVAEIEYALANINEKLERLSRQRAETPAPAIPVPRSPFARPNFPRPSPLARPEATPSPDPEFPSIEWIAARSADWWVGSLGVVFLVIASFLLYRYAVDHQWITPLLRVITGLIVGAGMFVAAQRFTSRSAADSDDAIGLREILLGGGIAVWYLSAYAAGIFYQLVSIQTARWLFLLLSILSGWIALKERRLLFAILALGVGFAAPTMLLPLAWPNQSVVGLALYLAPLGAIGLVLYLMRGWESVLWITFIGFWLSFPPVAIGRWSSTPTGAGCSLLAILFGGACVRGPILRRKLIAVDVARYGTESPGAKVGLWIIPIATPMIVASMLSAMWGGRAEAWGALQIALAAGAYWFGRYSNESDAKVRHLAMTASAIWSLWGLEWIAAGVISRTHIAGEPLVLGVAAVHAAVVIYILREKAFSVPRWIAKLTTAVALFAVLSYELNSSHLSPFRWDWTVAEGIVLALSAWLWLSVKDDPSEEIHGTIFSVVGYGTLLLVLARVLGALWIPLVTASYAVAGATLLLASRQSAGNKLLLRLGGATMLIVVGRLLIVDMSSVETIWRVLLFLACGIAFVGVSYRLQSNPVTQH